MTSNFSLLMFCCSVRMLGVGGAGVAPCRGRGVEVRVEQDLLLRQEGDQHVLAVIALRAPS